MADDVHDVLWAAYSDAGGDMDAGAVALAREVVRLRAKLQAVRRFVDANAVVAAEVSYHDDVLAALGEP